GLAPCMGLIAFFAFTVVGALGFTWQQALGAVFISGVIFILLTVSGARSWIIAGIPKSLRSAIAAGIGLFLGLIAMINSGIVVGNPATHVGIGNLTSHQALFAIFGFFVIAILDALRIRGAILIGILAVTVLSMITGHTSYQGLVSMPPSIAPTFMQLDIIGALNVGIVHVVLVLVLVEVFDATGTLLGVAKRANLIDEKNPGRLGRALFADSTAIVAGSVIGTSSTTAYVESASGVQAGGRTGLTALTVAVLCLFALFFSPLAGVVPRYAGVPACGRAGVTALTVAVLLLFALFFSPLAGVLPGCATAPALLYVAGIMLREVVEVELQDVTEAAPAALTALAMPFTYSIANGLAFGFISYVVLKFFTGKWKDLHLATIIVAVLFVSKYAFYPD